MATDLVVEGRRGERIVLRAVLTAERNPTTGATGTVTITSAKLTLYALEHDAAPILDSITVADFDSGPGMERQASYSLDTAAPGGEGSDPLDVGIYRAEFAINPGESGGADRNPTIVRFAVVVT